MCKFTIQLKSVNDVKDFVRLVSDTSYEVDLTSGRYIVDAKSIMGIFSLDLTKPIAVEIHGEAGEDLKKRLEIFVV